MQVYRKLFSHRFRLIPHPRTFATQVPPPIHPEATESIGYTGSQRQLPRRRGTSAGDPRDGRGGGEIVKLMGTSAYYAPASGTIQMVEAIIKDKRRILPCAAYCQKEYGVAGYFVGVPCILGKGGVESIVEVELDAAERKLLDSSVSHVKELVAVAEKFLKG